ncbi:MAG: hypothetical protein EOP19_08900 [Hyphomicrobiales bacterium]|nr:MAG: hypothetical protein EOP19_08900 [Hyphomicrobiales bacterium]
MRPFVACLGIAIIAMSSAAQAEITVGGYVYPDSAEATLREYCRGLEAQANQSLISDAPDDVYNGDLSSEYQLKYVPFSVRDCRRAGLS